MRACPLGNAGDRAGIDPEEDALKVVGLDHVQLAMPPGQEHAAREFYAGLLGLAEAGKPTGLRARGGVWFEGAGVKVHLGVDPDFRPARKAHPGLLVTDLSGLARALEQAGHRVTAGEPLDGYEHAYVDDPFGNRLELMEPNAGAAEE
jgi:catechol 2,3-dioxygenase-like lactoylglutathione lyase family enzyme